MESEPSLTKYDVETMMEALFDIRTKADEILDLLRDDDDEEEEEADPDS